MVISLIRTPIVYALILLGVRLMGKRQISQLQTSELVVTLLISELAVLPIQDHGKPLWNGLLPMCVVIVCELVVSLGMIHSGRFRKLVCGKPELVIREGKVIQPAMKRLRMSTEELFEQLRQAGAFSLDEVAWAVIETNGRMSVARKASEDFLTPKQAGVKVDPRALEVVVVSDGELSDSSLRLCDKDRDWALGELKKAGLSLPQVFIMTVKNGKTGRIVEREEGSERPLPH